MRGEIFALLPAADGRVWAGTENGLVVYSDGKWQRWPLREQDTGLKVFAILPDDSGGLWLGTDQGVYRVTDTRRPGQPVVQIRATRNGLVNDFVRAMAYDNDGALWLGTIAGANRYAGTLWQGVSDEGLASQRINVALTDTRGRTWVGTEANGLTVWDGGQWQRYSTRNGLPDNRIVSLFEDRAGRVWVGTGENVGYFGADGKWVFLGRATGLAGVPVYSIEGDADGSLWFGTQGGLSRWREGSGFEAISQWNGKRVNVIYRGRDGGIWLGTDGDGLFKLAAGQWQPVLASDGQPFRTIGVDGIVEGPDDGLWVNMYDDGLWRLAQGQWQRMDTRLTTPKVLSLGVAHGKLWVGTRVGLDAFDGKTWQAYVGDGLPQPEVFAISEGRNGVVWVGTRGGLVRYRPETSAPWVRVESVNFIPPKDGVVTLAGATLQAIRLTGGDIGTQRGYLRFFTQIEGLDAAPREQTDDLVTYNETLRGGSYLLRVWARDAAFNYSPPVEVRLIAPQVVALPGNRTIPANQFYPALGLMALALGGLATAGGVSLRARSKERQRTAEIAARQREALERHFNPYISGEPVRQPEMFFGRDELLRKILNALHRNSIMIHGERRMGKTTLLYQLAEQLRAADDPEWVFIPISVDLEGTPPARFFHLLMETTWGVLAGYLVVAPPTLRLTAAAPNAYSDRDFIADLQAILEPLKAAAAPRNVRLILLLDEMDVINSYDTLTQQQLRRIFMSSLAENLGAVVAGIQISKEWDRIESPWYNLFNEISLDPFSDQDSRRLLTEPVSDIYDWTPEALDFVVKRANGRPYRLQQYGLEAVNHMLAQGRVQITLADVQTAHEVIERARTG